jgi:hypothetical protein
MLCGHRGSDLTYQGIGFGSCGILVAGVELYRDRYAVLVPSETVLVLGIASDFDTLSNLLRYWKGWEKGCNSQMGTQGKFRNQSSLESLR